MRALVFVILLGATATADAKPAPTPAQARAANEAAFGKAVAKRKLKVLALKGLPADPADQTAEERFVTTLVSDSKGRPQNPTFVVDANKDVYRVVRKITAVGRVKAAVCHGRPNGIRVTRTRFEVPAGHTFKGDVEIDYDAWVIDELSSCR